MRILKTNGVRGMAQLFGKKLSKHLIQWSLVIAGALLWGQNWKIFELAFQPLFWFITPSRISWPTAVFSEAIWMRIINFT